MTRYRRLPLVREDSDEVTWVAALPVGPMVRLAGIGPLVLDLVPTEGPAVDVRGITEALRQLLGEVPSDAEHQVAALLAQLAGHGLVEVAEPPASQEKPGAGRVEELEERR